MASYDDGRTRPVYAMRRRPPSEDDRGLAFAVGACVDVLVDLGTRRERWRGEVVRAASGQTRSFELRPFGWSESAGTVEIDLGSVVGIERYAGAFGSGAHASIERIQCLRRGRARSR